MTNRNRFAAVAFLVVFAVVPVLAHHNITSEFDPSKERSVTGVLSKLSWANPHIYTYVDVKDEKTGQVETWGFEGNPPATIHRAGIQRSDWRIGETVTITYAAAKDGTKHLGFCKMIKYKDGHVLVFRVGGE